MISSSCLPHLLSLIVLSSLHFNCLSNILRLRVGSIRSQQRVLVMRDGSVGSSFFNVGDRVRVLASPKHQLTSLGRNDLKLPEFSKQFSSVGFEGIVNDVWEKCEVDPHCCCAELAFDAPISVAFNVTMVSCNEYGAVGNTSIAWSTQYAVDEIEKLAVDICRVDANVVRIEIDEDVAYLGNYADSKY